MSCIYILQEVVVKLYILVTSLPASPLNVSLTCQVFEANGGVLVHAGMSLVWAAVYVARGLPDVSLRWSERTQLKRGSVQCREITLHSHFLLPPPFLTRSPVYPLGEWGKKSKQRGSVRPTVQDRTLFIFPAAQDDFIFRIYKYFPMKALEIQEKSPCLTFLSASNLRPPRGQHCLAPQCGCYKNAVVLVMCSVSHRKGSWRCWEGFLRPGRLPFPTMKDFLMKSF